MDIKFTFKGLAGEYREIASDVANGRPRLKRNFLEAVDESRKELKNISSGLNLGTVRGKLLATTGVATVLSLAGISVAAFGLEQTVVQAFGLLGFGVALLAQRLKYNRSTLALMPVGGTMIAAQMAILGGWSCAVMGLIACGRAVVLNSLDDSKESERKRMLTGAGFYAVGLPAMLLLALYNPWSILSAMAMTGGTRADVMTSDATSNKGDMSHQSRALRFASGIANAAYNIALPQSWAAFAFDIATVFNKASVIHKNDIAVLGSYKKKPLKHVAKHYFLSLLQGKEDKSDKKQEDKTELEDVFDQASDENKAPPIDVSPPFLKKQEPPKNDSHLN